MADDNKLLREEETCKTDNSALLYTMSAILHIRILLHAAQPEPCRATRTSPRNQNLSSPRSQNPEPFLAAQPKPKTQNLPCAAPRRAARTQNLSSPRNLNPKHRTFLVPRRAARTQNVPGPSRFLVALVVMAVTRRDSIPPLGLEFLRERSGWAFPDSVHGKRQRRALPSSFLPVPMLAHRIPST